MIDDELFSKEELNTILVACIASVACSCLEKPTEKSILDVCLKIVKIIS